jgi:hypothetical protein
MPIIMLIYLLKDKAILKDLRKLFKNNHFLKCHLKKLLPSRKLGQVPFILTDHGGGLLLTMPPIH